MRNGTLAINQPTYMPWMGYFEQMARVDHFVFYDDVQYTKQDWRNRNQILGANGPIWLTVPVKRSSLKTQINHIEINNVTHWASKHLKAIRHCYSKAPYFDTTFEMLQDILEQDWRLLVELDVALVQKIAAKLEINPAMEMSSNLPKELDFSNQPQRDVANNAIAKRNLRIIEICRHFESDIYYTGARAANYIDTELFKKFGITVEFQDYKHPVYNQLGSIFQSHMSVIDLMMNTGPAARNLLLSTAPHSISK